MADKNKKQRSRYYPAYELGECVGWAGLIRSKLGSGVHDRESIARAIGSTGLTGTSTRKVAAMIRFGLLKRESHGYSLSPLSERINKPISESERRQAIVDAFMEPDLYGEIMDRCRADGRVPAMLPTILIRFYRMQDAAATHAAEIFTRSAQFAGVINHEGYIIDQETGEEEQSHTGDSVAQRESEAVARAAVSDQSQVASTLDDVGTHGYKYPLTRGRIAQLVVPSDLNDTDLRLLMMQIKSLALALGLTVDPSDNAQ